MTEISETSTDLYHQISQVPCTQLQQTCEESYEKLMETSSENESWYLEAGAGNITAEEP